MNKTTNDFFSKEHAERYDERNQKLSSISENLHFLMSLALEHLPANAKVLSVGAGTGAEILFLGQRFPNWTFVAVEPSLSMLNVCRERIQNAGFSDRCEFVHGYSHELPSKEDFDAVLAILVAHFVKREERLGFFQSLTHRLRPGGSLINAEISFDLNSEEFPIMLKHWESVQKLMGATPESLATLPKQLKEVLSILPPEETRAILQEAGVEKPLRFFQAFMISAWTGMKAIAK